jgi:hypothetical protein
MNSGSLRDLCGRQDLGPEGRRKWSLVMGAAMLANASAFPLLDGHSGGFKAGYYLWCLSFLIAAIGLRRLSGRTRIPVESRAA